jgi:HK97 family phage prohead protease
VPWTVSKDTSMCPVSKPWAVKKSDTGAKAGCHVSEADAKKQQAALYAQEKKSNMSVDTADNREANGDSRHRLGVRLALDDGSLEYRNDTDDAQPVMHGHFAVFNEWTRINSLFEGEFMERIAPGAFAKTFQERGDKIRVLYQHGRDPSTGAKPLGTPEVLSEDDRGAYYEVSLFDAPYVNELKPALRSGQLGASFKFEVMREDISDSAERSAHNPDGIQERTIKEVRLFEFGPVTFPAYEGGPSPTTTSPRRYWSFRSMTPPGCATSFTRSSRPTRNAYVH